jgi:hypothetical protein
VIETNFAPISKTKQYFEVLVRHFKPNEKIAECYSKWLISKRRMASQATEIERFDLFISKAHAGTRKAASAISQKYIFFLETV